MKQPSGGLMRTSVYSLAALCFLLSTAAVAQEGGLTLPNDHDQRIRLSTRDGSATPPRQRLQVFVGEKTACCSGKTAMAGRYASENDTLSFEPMFPFLRGQPYTVLSHSDDGARRLTEFTLGTAAAPIQPDVIAIVPTGPVIPENTLRFYIDFATPMQPHRAEEFIELIDAEGVVDNAAFMTFKQELWNEDRTRLTLLMDPGRIKRGVAQNLALGPALEQGASYTFRVKAGWPAATSGRASRSFQIRFDVGPPLRTRPDPSAWTVTAPRANSSDPLVLDFDRPFDRVQLGHSIAILDVNGSHVDGTTEILRQDTVWRFSPIEKWDVGEVTVIINAGLEDVAGNTFREVLDHNLGSVPLDIDEVSLTVTLTP